MVIESLCRIIICALCAALITNASIAQTASPTDGHYTHASPTRDGIGKRYFGREIAQIMGNRGVPWLEITLRVAI